MNLQPIGSIEDIEPDDFVNNFLKKNKPVILKNFISKESPAWDKWDYDYFKQLAGKIQVNVFGREEETVEMAASNPIAKMTFEEYLNLIEREPTELRLFLFNLMVRRPELEKDIIYNDPTKGKILKQLPLMFFGGEGSSTRNHFDIDMSHVFITQFKGIKRIWLFPPEQSNLLYKPPYNFHSTINLKTADKKEYPAINYLDGYEAVIGPGDTLFMPSGWWHFIQYETEGYSVSVRALASNTSQRLRGLSNMLIARNFDNAMRRLLKKRWFNYKLNVAKLRAEKKLKSLQHH